MNMMVTELYDALISAGADEAKARRAAEGIAESDQQFKRQFSDLREDNQKMRTEMASLRGTLQQEMTSLKGGLQQEMASLKGGLQQEMASLKGGLQHDMGGIRVEMQAIRGELSLVKWMGGVLIGLAIAILLRIFLA